MPEGGRCWGADEGYGGGGAAAERGFGAVLVGGRVVVRGRVGVLGIVVVYGTVI